MKMISSDSEDDCYGNAAQKLLNMKKKYEDDTLEKSHLLDDSLDVDRVIQHANLPASSGNVNTAALTTKSVSASTDEPDDVIIQKIISDNASLAKPKRATRSSRRSCVDNSIATESPAPKRGRRGGGRGRGRGKKNQTAENCDSNIPSTSAQPANSSTNVANIASNSSSSTSIPTGSNRGRRRNNFHAQCMSYLFPTYSVGNTDEYPDQSDSQPLFSNKPAEVVSIDDDVEQVEDENEELSVKVYWQSSEFFKFRIRKFQKISQIFDHFACKEKVSHDKLLLTYNERILKPDDTPDSISYSIAKFIDGGIVNQSITKLVRSECDIKNGVRLKFQIQNVKKPIEIMANLDDKFSIVMMKCAEHLEKPIESLRFHFDGDSISGKITARELDLEGGECIDVKIVC